MSELFGRFDDWLVDRVYQPLADKVADRCSCFDLAVVALDSVATLIFLQFALKAYANGATIFGTILLLILLTFISVIRTTFMVIGSKQSVGQMNPYRLQFRFMRLFVVAIFIGFLILHTIEFFFTPETFKLWDIVSLMEIFSWVCAYMFASCQINPPMEKTAMEEDRAYA